MRYLCGGIVRLEEIEPPSPLAVEPINDISSGAAIFWSEVEFTEHVGVASGIGIGVKLAQRHLNREDRGGSGVVHVRLLNRTYQGHFGLWVRPSNFGSSAVSR